MNDAHSKEYLDLIHKEIFKSLGRIEDQTTATNGRVTRLERFMWTLLGAVSVFALIEFDQIIKIFTS